jgi:hypothetical protein
VRHDFQLVVIEASSLERPDRHEPDEKSTLKLGIPE